MDIALIPDAAGPPADAAPPRPLARSHSGWFRDLRRSVRPAPRAAPPTDSGAEDLAARTARWLATVDAADPIATSLARRAARLEWAIERAGRAEADLLARLADRTADRRADRVERLGTRLLALADAPRSSRPPDPPAVLLRRLMATPEGCQWLLNRWLEFAAMVDLGVPWDLVDLRRFIRLLGKRPFEAAYDASLNAFLVAFEPIWPGAGAELFEACRPGPRAADPGLLRHRRWRALGPAPTDARGFQEAVLGMIGAQIRRVQRRRDELVAAASPTDASVESPGLERLRKRQLALARELRLTLDRLGKLRPEQPAEAAERPAAPIVAERPQVSPSRPRPVHRAVAAAMPAAVPGLSRRRVRAPTAAGHC